MSKESQLSKIIETLEIHNDQDIDNIINKLSQIPNVDQQTINLVVEQLKQKKKNDLLHQKEVNIPIPRKKIQGKSKIEINCLIQTGPISPYTIFLKHMHQILIDANKNISFSQRSVLIANLWAMMSEKDKEPFKYSANKANEREK